MKKILLVSLFFIFSFLALPCLTQGQKPVPDTVSVGIYITGIHDIDFRQKEYSINFWLWLKYRNKEFDFQHNLEIPDAKSVMQTISTIDTSGEVCYMLTKLQCVMKESWKIDNFPYDHQKMRIFIENSKFGVSSLVFIVETKGAVIDPRFTMRGWKMDSLSLSTSSKRYDSSFGKPGIIKQLTDYSTIKIMLGMTRDSDGLFWKIFSGMYMAFLMAYVCFYIHSDSINSRFILSIGALLAVIGNKYILEPALPESITYTLVDTLHGITMIFILLTIVCTAYYFKLVKKGKARKAGLFDFLAAQLLLIIYVILNFYYISQAQINL